ncbi:MAG: ABC transporter substrate-binding protein [Bacillota bacterium]|jgi:branched-chain amino acid transport system substrate-binding protein|nr:ABC transporter substrate-binding protein [Bacillota bacterium]
MKKLSAMILALTLCLAFCGTCMAEGENIVKIGVILPFSGGSAATGELQMRGIQMYADRVNNNGGIKSMNGAKIVLVKADTMGLPEVGVTEMERLIAENADMAAIIGPYQSGVGAATVPIAEKYGMPYMIVNCTTDSVLGDPNVKYSFRANLSNLNMSYTFIDLFKAFNEIKPDSCRKIAMVYESTDWGSGVYNNTVNYVVEPAGVELVMAEAFDSGMADFSAIINKLKASGADVVIPAMYLSDAILFTTQMYEYDCNIPIVAQGGGFTVSEFYPSVGELANYLFSNSPWTPDIVNSRSEEAQQIRADYIEQYGLDLTEYEVNGWLGMGVLADALERCASTDHDTLAAAMLATNLTPDDDPLMFHDYTGVTFGTVNGNIYNQNTQANACAMQFFDGMYKYVTCSADDPVMVWPVPAWSER